MRGDLPDFEEFVAARQHRLLRVAFLLTRDHHRAEDLLQDAFVKVYRRWRHEGPPEHSEAYLRRVMVNMYISSRRHRRSTEVPLLEDDLVDTAGPSVPTDDRLIVWRALGVLTARQRAVLVLRIYEGMTDEEIADHLHCAAGTVRSLASRAYTTLRTHSELLDWAASAPKEKC
ncbi:MAG: SigE family RNA polymerase sigma factor [Candidatus Lutibacillus vidarii]|jgi:RNA polymerase sigma-70 factor (sigma-E family)|nr:SigE family RNA polymerase sigma factor [Candidatus Lutibacillus vidarii]HON76083.1 SigE family RNA polymerase sigma factor [Dermatophilaceae bacterium]